ncbi:MAG: hypothetical protein R3F59_31910 [Myxococcota bacterium]
MLAPLLPALAVAALASTPAEEAGGASSMATVLLLLGVVALAYLAGHFVVERAQQRFLFVSGVEYVALGMVLGPTVLPQVQPFADFTRLGPIFAFAAGWVGLLYGLELESRTLRTVQPLRIALLDTLIAGGLVTVVSQPVLRLGLLAPDPGRDQAWAVALLLGCTAAAGSSGAIDLLQSRYGDLKTRLLPLLSQTTWFGALVAITGFGLLFCVFHRGGADVPWWAWALLTLGLGVVLGLVFWMFIAGDHDANNVFLAMVGILLFASGAAFFLDLSALLVNLVLGAVLAQTRHGGSLRQELVRTARPVRLVLLLFAGANWRPVPIEAGVAMVVGFLVLRLVAKVIAAGIATVGTGLRLDLFRGLMSQGDVAVAMALSFRLVYEGPLVDLAYTAVLVGVVLHETLVSTRMLRGLLVDADEAPRGHRSRRRAELTWPAPPAPERRRRRAQAHHRGLADRGRPAAAPVRRAHRRLRPARAPRARLRRPRRLHRGRPVGGRADPAHHRLPARGPAPGLVHRRLLDVAAARRRDLAARRGGPVGRGRPAARPHRRPGAGAHRADGRRRAALRGPPHELRPVVPGDARHDGCGAAGRGRLPRRPARSRPTPCPISARSTAPRCSPWRWCSARSPRRPRPRSSSPSSTAPTPAAPSPRPRSSRW